MATQSEDTIKKYENIVSLFIEGYGIEAVAAMDDIGICKLPGLLDYISEEKYSHSLALHAAKSYFYVKSL